MSYEYDIFISYRRDPETREWIKNHFRPLLEHALSLVQNRAVEIFLDEQLEAGATWPIELGIKLGRSRILIPLLTRSYFSSKWCSRELGLMLSREQETGCRKDLNSGGIIIPMIIHDGKKFPPVMPQIQRIEIQDCFNVRMAKDSPRAEQLAAVLEKWAEQIAEMIELAPAWQSAWQQQAAEEFYKLLFQEEAPQQDSVPRLTP